MDLDKETIEAEIKQAENLIKTYKTSILVNEIVLKAFKEQLKLFK